MVELDLLSYLQIGRNKVKLLSSFGELEDGFGQHVEQLVRAIAD